MKIINNKKIIWINCEKAIAIFAVLVDHSRGILYSSAFIQKISFFSVSLFVIISGYLSYITFDMHDVNYSNFVVKKLKNIVVDYMIATFIYQIILYHYFDLKIYITYLIHFNVSGPFYYILLYIQLMCVAYVFLKFLIINHSVIKEFIVGIFILVFSVFSVNKTNILNVYGGRGVLFGSTYLFLFYFGMLMAKYNIVELINKSIYKKIFILLFSILIISFSFMQFYSNVFILDKYKIFGDGINPPGFSLMLYSIAIFFVLYFIFVEKCCIKIIYILSFIGEHTLYIFLYHRLFLDQILINYLIINNNIFKCIIYMCLMIFFSILTEKIIIFLKERICKILSN